MYTGIIYCSRLVNTSDDDTLKNVVYIGQSTKKDMDENEILKRRRRQHETTSKRSQKEVGFMFALASYGEDSFTWEVVETKTDPDRLVIAEWVNEREMHHIHLHGGIFKHFHKRVPQTFNLTNGGQGNPKFYWDSMMVRSNRKFEIFVTHLSNYKKEYGNCDVPSSYEVDEYKLGKRVISVRGGNMIRNFPERKKQLENMEFTWNTLDKKFDVLYRHLSEYKKEYGHCDVPQAYKVDGYSLGSVVCNVRQGAYENYIDKLLELGIDLNPAETRWTEVKTKLQDFFNEHGHSRVPLDYPIIGRIVNHIRNRRDFIDEDPSRIEFLNGICFDFKPRETAEEISWNLFWSHMMDYYVKNNNYNVSCTFVCDDGYSLGSCITCIRRGQFRNDPEKMKLLDSIQFSFDPLEDKWQEFNYELLKFKNVHKTCKVPGDYVTPDTKYSLGQTVSTVRTGTYLNVEGRRDYLTSIGFIWKVHDYVWEDFLYHFDEYIKSGNVITRSTKCKDGYNLGSRIHNIKTRGQFVKNYPERVTYLMRFGITYMPK